MKPLRLIQIFKYSTGTELRAALSEGPYKEHPFPTVCSMDESIVSDFLECLLKNLPMLYLFTLHVVLQLSCY